MHYPRIQFCKYRGSFLQWYDNIFAADAPYFIIHPIQDVFPSKVAARKVSRSRWGGWAGAGYSGRGGGGVVAEQDSYMLKTSGSEQHQNVFLKDLSPPWSNPHHPAKEKFPGLIQHLSAVWNYQFRYSESKITYMSYANICNNTCWSALTLLGRSNAIFILIHHIISFE